MKKNLILCAALAAIAFAGCNKDENNLSTDGRTALQVTSGILTRAFDNQWENGDAIGIYMVKTTTATPAEGAENRPYTTPNGGNTFSTTPENTIYFPVDGSQVDFLAYYPYQASLTDGELMLDVSNQSNLSAIDLMTAKVQSTPQNPIDKNHPQVAFNFSHILTKLELKIAAGDGVNPDDLKNLKVEITKQCTRCSYDPLLETFAIQLNLVQTLTLKTNADGTVAEAILLPNDAIINEVIPGRELVFTLPANGNVFKWSIPDTKLFKRGDKNIYNITLNRIGLEVTATIADWNNGNGMNGEDGSAE